MYAWIWYPQGYKDTLWVCWLLSSFNLSFILIDFLYNSGLMWTVLTALISTPSTKVSSLILLAPVQMSHPAPLPSAKTVPPPAGLRGRETGTVLTVACAALMAVPTHVEKQRSQPPLVTTILHHRSPSPSPPADQWSPRQRLSTVNLLGEDRKFNETSFQ